MTTTDIVAAQAEQQRELEQQRTTEYPSGTTSSVSYAVPAGETLTVPSGVTLYSFGVISGLSSGAYDLIGVD
jgi:hypothetical protein